MAFDKSAALYARACQVLVNGVASDFRRKVTSPPLYIERAEGPYYYDADGHQLVDYTLAWGPLICGSAHPAINAAVNAQLQRSYTLGCQHELEIRFGEALAKAVPGLELSLISNTGSEAVQAALRVARAGTGRPLIVKFEGHYHGWMSNVLVSYHPSQEQLGQVVPVVGGQPANEYAQIVVVPWNDLAALKAAFAKYPGQIAAVIGEPLLANSGSIPPEPGFLRGWVDLCREHGAYSIFDEVITGFRLALGGAREYYGVIPDLSVYAKALAAGFSLAAVGGSKKAFAPLLEGKSSHMGTYNGSPINLAASVAALELLGQPGVYQNMHSHGYALREIIEQEAKANGITLVTSGVGTVFSVHWGLSQAPRCYAETMATDATSYAKFRRNLLERGVQLLPDGRWYVGMTHTEREIELVRPAIVAAMKDLR